MESRWTQMVRFGPFYKQESPAQFGRAPGKFPRRWRKLFVQKLLNSLKLEHFLSAKRFCLTGKVLAGDEL